MKTEKRGGRIGKKLFELLPRKQKTGFVFILLILAVSAVLSQITPLAIGYLTDHVLAGPAEGFLSVFPILGGILLVNVINEVLKVARRLMVEDAATQAEKRARQRAADSLLRAPLFYVRSHMTGNIHGRLNRSLEGTVKLIKLLFMDFAPAVSTGLAAVVTIFLQLPVSVACLVILVIPAGTAIVFRQISTQKGIRVELMETKADMDGAMVELLGGMETIRTLDSAGAEGERIGARSEKLRKKEMRHHRAMAFYDCLKFINEAVFSVLVIGISVFLASRQIITVGTVLTAYLCFTQLTGPLRELHRILDEFSECVVLADDYFRLLDLPVDFSYREGEGQTDHAAGDEDIFLRHVNFAYPEKTDREVLTDINLYIPSGTFLGIAGPSGCGKSTLIRVLDKLEQAGGEICIGGKPLSEGGKNLSGGQRQRIALARIFLRKPRILILDEATSALDNTSEKRIQAEIEKMNERDKTTVISIAHRLTTLRNCHELIVMDRGRIVQRGTFSELENQPGLFRDMARGIVR